MQQVRLTKTISTLGLAAATVALLAACGGGAQAGPAPSPTWTCTPDASAEPCTPEKAAAQKEEAEAYAEAMHAYREFTKERNLIGMSGGTATPTAEMTRHAAGSYLNENLGFLASAQAAGRRADAPMQIVKLEAVSFHGESLELLACEDGREVNILDREGQIVGTGKLGAVLLTATNADGEWQVTDGESVGAERCD